MAEGSREGDAFDGVEFCTVLTQANSFILFATAYMLPTSVHKASIMSTSIANNRYRNQLAKQVANTSNKQSTVGNIDSSCTDKAITSKTNHVSCRLSIAIYDSF